MFLYYMHIKDYLTHPKNIEVKKKYQMKESKILLRIIKSIYNKYTEYTQ